MGLFKEIFCSDCGAKTGLLMRTRLRDGNYLCSKCVSCVPDYMRKSFDDSYTFEDYQNFKEYVAYSNETLRPMFHETHRYGTIRIDVQNGIFCVDSSIDDKTLFLNFHDVNRFELLFKAEEFKESVFGDKVTGKVLFELGMDYPPFYYDTVLLSDVKGKAKKKLFGNKIEYDNPEGMDEFSYYFRRTWQEDVDFVKEYEKEHGREGDNV